MIKDQGESVQVPSFDDFSLEYLDKLQEDDILNMRVRTLQRYYFEYLHVGLQGMHLSKSRWMKTKKLRELYPHLFYE